MLARLLVVVATAACAACSTAPTRHTEAVPELRVSGLVVEQLRISGGVSDDEVLALSARVGLRAVSAAAGRALVWGPSEIHPLHPERTDWTATDGLGSIKASGLSPAE